MKAVSLYLKICYLLFSFGQFHLTVPELIKCIEEIKISSKYGLFATFKYITNHFLVNYTKNSEFHLYIAVEAQLYCITLSKMDKTQPCFKLTCSKVT